MLVVSDTTPIISLLKIDKLSLLPEMFEEILVPEAVYKELTANSAFEEEAKIISHSSFIKIREVSNMDNVQILQRATGLDKGESEAIILADEVDADLLLMDENQGRNVAKRMGINITGTIGILINAYQSGLLNRESVLSCIGDLKNSRRFISDALYDELLQIIDANN